MLKPIRHLTLEEFNSVISHLRLSQENVLLVRKVLVDGVPLNLISKEINGKSRQTIEKAVKRVWDKFLQLQETPANWVSIRVDLPLDEAMRVKTREKELKQELMKKAILDN